MPARHRQSVLDRLVAHARPRRASEEAGADDQDTGCEVLILDPVYLMMPGADAEPDYPGRTAAPQR